MWEFDAVLRLADAQIAAALSGERADPRILKEDETPASPHLRLQEQLAVANYVRPGPLWWAFNWESARRQAERTRTPIPRQLSNADPGKGLRRPSG